VRLTKAIVQQLPSPTAGKYKIYRDDKLTGFCVRVMHSGIKTFIVDKKINKKLQRITIGRFGQLTVDQARQQAQKVLSQLCMGVDPQHTQKEGAPVITLEQVFNDYLRARKSLGSATIKDYEFVIKREFSDWEQQPLTKITTDMVIKRHVAIGKRSQYSADKAFRVLRALFNFAMCSYEDADGNSLIAHNPVAKLSKTRAWYPKTRRRTKIETHELAIWFEAVNALRNENQQSIANSVKYYLLVLLFTGLRRSEAIRLMWSEYQSDNPEVAKKQRIVDLTTKTLLIPDPKNGEAHTLPLSDYLVTLLTRHKAQSQSQYLFPDSSGKTHIKEPRKIMDRVTAQTGISFILSDLRRTFISIAESLDIPAYALKRLLNHKIIGTDVTAGYIVSDVERLKKPMQKIAGFILENVAKNV